MNTKVKHAHAAPVVRLRGLSKRFAGVRALDGVDLDLAAGEIHGLLGENGSGKSTLIKVLAGFHTVDGGTLEFNGSSVPLPLSSGTAQELGIQFVHQDLALIPSLSVLENLRLSEFRRRRAWISWADERRQAREVFERYGIDLDPQLEVSEIRPVQRAQLAIARAMEAMQAQTAAGESGPGLLVLDEPTVFLPSDEVAHLFRLIREVVAGGAAVLFVSHDIGEIKEITDRVTVLRDGVVAGSAETQDVDEGDLVEMIVGHQLSGFVPASAKPPVEREPTVVVRDLTGASVRNIEFSSYEGEILGLTGLVGAGYDEILYFLAGATHPESGSLELFGDSIELRRLSPGEACRRRIALIPADRQADGIVPSLSVTDNITLPVLDQHTNGVMLRRRRLRRLAAELMETYDVRPRDPSLPFSALSGGNQQKALLAKWLQTRPRVILLHEPTQGVDVGAREQIFEVVREQAAAGATVLCASSDHEQLAAICHRVLVFGRGRVVSELSAEDLTSDRITEQCLRSLAAPAGTTA